jgi:hypothetical protein
MTPDALLFRLEEEDREIRPSHAGPVASLESGFPHGLIGAALLKIMFLSAGDETLARSAHPTAAGRGRFTV